MAQDNIFSHTKNYVVKFGLRRETMKEIIEADTDPMKEVLRPCYASGQHLLPHKKLCCQIWVQGGRP